MCIGLGNFRAVEIVLATQNLRDAVRQVLSSCSLPLDYVDAALQVRDASSRLSQNDQLSETIKASILERFYGFNPHDHSRIHPRRTARDTLRLLLWFMWCSYVTVCTC